MDNIPQCRPHYLGMELKVMQELDLRLQNHLELKNEYERGVDDQYW